MDRKPPLSFNSEILWKHYKLGSLITKIETGTNELGKETITDFPLLKMGNIQLGTFDLSKLEYLKKDQFDNSKKYIAKNGDFLFNTRNTLALVGKAATWTIDDKDFVFNSNVARISLDDSKICSHFLNYLYATSSIWSQVKARAVGTTSVAAVYPKDLSSIKLFIPDLEEQEKISMFFRQLDLRIHLQQEKVDLLKEQKKGYMQKIFSQELQFKGENGQAFPEWQRILVKDVLSLNLREVPKPSSAYTRLGLRSHAKGTFHELVIDTASVNMDTLYEVYEGDFIINITFAWEQALAVADKEDHGKLVSHRFPTYRFKENHDKNFYKYFFTTKYFKYCLGNASPGGAGRNRVLNKTDFMKIEVTVPTLKEQIKISNFLDTLQSKINLAEQKLQSLKDQKKSFMQQMFI